MFDMGLTWPLISSFFYFLLHTCMHACMMRDVCMPIKKKYSRGKKKIKKNKSLVEVLVEEKQGVRRC